MRKDTYTPAGLPTHEEIMKMFPDTNFVHIFDPRDIKEMNRRKEKKTFQPLRHELYSVNPDFNGVYSDPENR